MAADRELEEREVVSEDPAISPEANRLLTEEARAAVGSDRVRVPPGTPRATRDKPRDDGTAASALAENRMLLTITFFALLVTGVTVTLSTGNWWAVVATSLIHAIGTFVVIAMLADRTRATEHASPGTAARLEAEGVADPDARLTDLVEEYSSDPVRPRNADMAVAGANQQTAEHASAAVQQQTANTPASNPSAHAGDGFPVYRLMPKAIVGASLLFATVCGALSPFLGIGFLLVPAVTFPVAAAWLALNWRSDGEREEQAASGGRALAEAGARRRRLLGIVAGLLVAIVIFVALMGVIAGEL